MTNNKISLNQDRLPLVTTTTGILSLFIALIAVSSAAILIRLSEAELGPGATIFNRLWIATAVLAIWQGVKPSPKTETTQIQSKDLALFILLGVVSTASVVCWAWSLTQTSVANSTLLRNLTPIFTTLGAWLLSSQTISKTFLMGLIIALGGAILIGWDDFDLSRQHLLGDSIALVSALFYAIYLLTVEKLRLRWGSSSILLWRCGIGALCLFPLVWWQESQIFPQSWQSWLVVICLGVICQVVGQGLIIENLKQFSSKFIAIFLLLEPILSALLAWLVFGEALTLLNGLAFILVLWGIYLAKQ